MSDKQGRSPKLRRVGKKPRKVANPKTVNRTKKKGSVVPKASETMTGATQKTDVGHFKAKLKAEYNKKHGLNPDGTKPSAPVGHGADFIEAHVKLATEHEFVTTLDGGRKAAAERYLLFYASIEPTDLVDADGNKIKRSTKAFNETLADFGTVSREKRKDIKHGIAVARAALTQTFEEAGGVPKDKPVTPVTNTKPTAPVKVQDTKPTPAPVKLEGITPLMMPRRLEGATA